MTDLKIFDNVDIRTVRPVFKREIEKPHTAKPVLDAMNAFQDGGDYIVVMEHYNGVRFYNRLPLENMIFLVAQHSRCRLCSAERSIAKHEFPEFDYHTYLYLLSV